MIRNQCMSKAPEKNPNKIPNKAIAVSCLVVIKAGESCTNQKSKKAILTIKFL